ncbi:MAG TPA: hypothetical protein DC047_07050 [Blastocatellia bacterium]|nr:hypothetical protein [Blastocatellia bacterium]
MINGFLQLSESASGYALACPSVGEEKADREEEGLVGRVQMVSLETVRSPESAFLASDESRIPLRMISFNDMGNKTKVVKYDPANPFNHQIEEYDYDPAGRKIEKTLKQGSIVIKTIYHYDDEHNRIETLERVSDGRHLVTRKYSATMDSQGNQISATYQDDSILEIKASYGYEFDEQRRIRIIQTYDSSGSLYHKIVFGYDSNGNLAKKSYYGTSGLEYERRVFAYKTPRRVEERLTFDQALRLKRRIVSRYDDRNNMVEICGYDSKGSLLGKTSHALQYDNTGNWIQRVSQTLDLNTDNPTSEWIEYQVISYEDLP